MLHTIGLVGILITYHWINHCFRDADLIRLFAEGKQRSQDFLDADDLLLLRGWEIFLTGCFPVLVYNWEAGVLYALLFNGMIILFQSTFGPLGGVGGLPWVPSQKRADKVRLSGMAAVLTATMDLSVPY